MSNTQKALLKRVEKAGRYRPYGSDWRTFYALKRLGFLQYDPPGVTTIVLTDAGRAALKQAEG